jgi:hypothetical protein
VKLTYNNPAYPKGEEIAITGIEGLVKNGESFELTDEQVKEFKARTGNSLADVVDGNDNFTKGGAK